MKNNKKYSQPKIESIELNPNQAILEVCQVGGGYLFSTNSCVVTGIPMRSCQFTPKGGTGTAVGLGNENAFPS
ncbi:MAG: hypothetical protein PHQ52_08095 [Candidatus Omnitrophica bacterium]|nr:hypothetical protein [Candidatus Omnitrophota bacterium]